MAKADKAAIDRKKFGGSINTSVLSNVTGGKAKTGIQPVKLGMAVKKLQDAPIRLLKELDCEAIFPELCKKCQKHVSEFVHLTCGRGG